MACPAFREPSDRRACGECAALPEMSDSLENMDTMDRPVRRDLLGLLGRLDLPANRVRRVPAERLVRLDWLDETATKGRLELPAIKAQLDRPVSLAHPGRWESLA